MRYGMAAASVGALMLAAVAAARADAPALTPVPGSFTPDQRAEIVAIVRQALKTDPTILRDAVVALRDEEAKTQAADQASAAGAHRAELLTGDAVAGNPVGDVTLTEFYDPRCPYCRRMAGTIDGAIADDRKLRVVYRLIPILGGQSVVEARAILAAGRQGRYVAMRQALMAGGQTDIATAARQAGVDPKRLAADMAAPAVTRQLDENLALAKALDVTGTPTLVIGTTLFPGEIEAADLRQAIAQARG